MSREARYMGEIQRPNVPGMTTRLANVLYWACCVLALIWIGYVLLSLGSSPIIGDLGPILAVAFCGAALIWMIGRAIRYVMVGK
jgi:hypothetical protein